MTGWNLPPGCRVSDIPGNGNEDETCQCCGRDAAVCICPECYMPGCCGAQGNPSCYAAGHLEYSPAQVAGRDAYLAARDALDTAWRELDDDSACGHL